QDVIRIQDELRAQVGKPKSEYVPAKSNEALTAKVRARAESQIASIVASRPDRDERAAELVDLRDTVLSEYASAETAEGAEVWTPQQIKESYEDIVAEETRRRTLNEGIRADGRTPKQLRKLSADVGLVPRVHGSGLFQRGQTQ